MTRIDEFQTKQRNLKRFIDLSMRDSLTRTDDEDAELRELYRERRSFLLQEPALLAQWQLAETTYEQQFPLSPEEIALMLGAERVGE